MFSRACGVVGLSMNETLNSFFRALKIYGLWSVTVELLLIGLVVFYVVRFLRGTRGARLLKGIAV